MKAIEKEFIEKQKITIDLERRKATEKQEKALAVQQQKYEKELNENKKKIEQLDQWRKKVQEEKQQEVSKFQDQIDALEDKEYKKTLDHTKDMIQKEKEYESRKEDVKKTLEYISSFNTKDMTKVNATEEMKNLEEQDADKVAESVAASSTTTDGIDKAQNNNDQMIHPENISESQLSEEQLKEEDKKTEIMVLKAMSETKKDIVQDGQAKASEKNAVDNKAGKVAQKNSETRNTLSESNKKVEKKVAAKPAPKVEKSAPSTEVPTVQKKAQSV